MTDLTKLGVIGYKKGLDDGEFSAVEGVKAFQEKNGLSADGIVGPLTWEQLTKER